MKQVWLLLPLVVLLQGCASYMKVQSHNATLDRQAFELRVQSTVSGDASVMAGMDLLGAKGYIAAWKSDPKGMIRATAVDIASGAGAYFLYEELRDKIDELNADTKRDAQVNVETGDVNSPLTVNIIAGDGNTSSDDGSGASESAVTTERQ